MLVVVAVDAEQLPVASVGRVVVVVVVLVVDRELAQPPARKLAPTRGAHVGQQLERALAVALGSVSRLAPPVIAWLHSGHGETGV